MATENHIKTEILNIFGENEEMREQLASLLMGLHVNTGTLAEMNKVLEPVIGSFLFEKDKQLNIVLNKGEPDIHLSQAETLPELTSEVIELNNQIFENPVLFKNNQLNIKSPGDIEIHSIFERRRVEDRKYAPHKCNELETCFTITGFPSVDMIAHVVSEFIRRGAAKGFNLNTKDTHAALSELFPETTKTLDDIVDLAHSQFNFEHGTGFIKCSIEGEFNMKGLKEVYPSLYKILGHIQHLNIDLLEVGNDEFVQAPTNSEEDREFLKYINEANCGWQLRIDNRGGVPTFGIFWTAPQDGDTLLWNDSNGLPIPGKILGFDVHKHHRFLVSLNYSLRIKELGCASISLPRVVLNMNYNPPGTSSTGSQQSDYAKRPGFHLEMFFFEKQNIITRTLIRPFINLNLLRELMQIRFFIHLAIEKAENEQVGKADSQLNLNFRATLLPPPYILSSCLKLFVKQHLSNQGDLLLYKNLSGAVGNDLQNLAALDNLKDNLDQLLDDFLD